jgi:acyl-CoA thioesterase-2
VYGGHVLAYAMMAAEASRPPLMPLHSLHGYFLRPGKTSLPCDFSVAPLRNGASFATREVTARQGGEAIFSGLFSFHCVEDDPTGGALGHQAAQPTAPPPDACAPLPGLEGLPLEVRQVAPRAHCAPEPVWPARALIWMRARGLPPASPPTAHLHRAAALFCSDWGVGLASLLPYNLHWTSPLLAITASLDHAMYFHGCTDGGEAPPPPGGAPPPPQLRRHADAPRAPQPPVPPLRADEWMLFEFESTVLRNARGFNTLRLWQNGVLFASGAQESLLRARGGGGDAAAVARKP